MSASTPTAKPQNKLARYIPILTWLPHYDRAWLTVDVIAGLTLWVRTRPMPRAFVVLTYMLAIVTGTRFFTALPWHFAVLRCFHD